MIDPRNTKLYTVCRAMIDAALDADDNDDDEPNPPFANPPFAAPVIVDWDAVTVEVVETGELSREHYERIVALGVPGVVIEDYVRAVSKEAAEHIETVIDGFGGEEAFDSTFMGVQDNATDEQKDIIDGLLKNKDTFQIGVDVANQLAKRDTKETQG